MFVNAHVMRDVQVWVSLRRQLQRPFCQNLVVGEVHAAPPDHAINVRQHLRGMIQPLQAHITVEHALEPRYLDRFDSSG